jgi:hypothetical protein
VPKLTTIQAPAYITIKKRGYQSHGPDEQYLHARITAWYEDGRKGWNATSHMSEREYERTCLQMARERLKFLDDEAKRGCAQNSIRRKLDRCVPWL